MVIANRQHLRNYYIILATCVLVSILGFVFRPHDCKSTYGPPPFHYNTDLTLWVHLAEQPIDHLRDSILANRPMFAYLGWVFAQPVKLIVGNTTITSPVRSGGEIGIPAATVAGLFLANYLCFFLGSLALYHYTLVLFGDAATALIAAMLWVTSYFAYGWSYHPVNQMGGLLVIFVFPWLLWTITKKPTLRSNLVFGLVMGLLLLMKAYYILPLVYLVWGLLHHFDWKGLMIGFIVAFLPTIVWQQLYVQITGIHYVDYHLGSGGLPVFLLEKLIDLPAVLHSFIISAITFPQIVLNAAGWPIVLVALSFFYFSHQDHRDFVNFAIIYTVGFYVFLTLSGFFIPRHGSDFFPLIFPATAFMFMHIWKLASTRKKYLLLGAWLVYTAITYSFTWLCVAEVL